MVAQVFVISLVFLGHIPFVSEKVLRRGGGFLHHFFTFVSQVLQLFLAFSLKSVSFGVFSHSKGGGFKMTRLSSGVLCSKWLSPPKRVFGVFPKLFCTFVSEPPAVLGVNGCCFRKGSAEGSPNYSLHLSPKWLLFHKKFFGTLPVSSWGQSWVNCWHVSTIQIQSAENDPSRRCCWGILWAYF